MELGRITSTTNLIEGAESASTFSTTRLAGEIRNVAATILLKALRLDRCSIPRDIAWNPFTLTSATLPLSAIPSTLRSGVHDGKNYTDIFHYISDFAP